MYRKFVSLLVALVLSMLSTGAYAASYPSPPSQVEDAAVSGGGNLTPVAAERQDSNDTARTNADGDSTQLTANKFGNLKVQIEPTSKAAFFYSSGLFSPAASCTDFGTITGSASKTVKIHKIWVFSTVGSAIANVCTVYILRRSSADTGGTSSTITAAKADSSSAADTCVVKSYTANPTSLGTGAGTLFATNLCANLTSSYINGLPQNGFLVFDDSNGGPPITLRGTSEVLALNGNGVSLALTNIAFAVLLTEE